MLLACANTGMLLGSLDYEADHRITGSPLRGEGFDSRWVSAMLTSGISTLDAGHLAQDGFPVSRENLHGRG